ncbi:hypothetical protein IWW56_002616 [Coemansia sp. RSA 2131]|nr:hypothetical protein IWW56_002616 [Coemansia sp. RSA 2131]
MFTALPFPATDAALPETVARAIQELNGPLCDTANVQYSLATLQDRSRYPACPTCGITFGLFRRKHNCVNCGQVVCSDCLNNKWYLPKYGIKTPVSCCTMCNRNLQLSIKSKPELERCTIRELRAYLTVYGLYDPNKMIEKSDLVAAVYNNSPMPNANECHYRLSLPRPSDSAKSSQRRQEEQSGNSRRDDGSSGSGFGNWDRMFASIGNDIGHGLESLGQNIERGASAVSDALGSEQPSHHGYGYPGTPSANGPQTYSHSYTRSQQYPHVNPSFFAHPPQPPQPPQPPRSTQSSSNLNGAWRQGASTNTGPGVRASDPATSGRSSTPNANRASDPATSTHNSTPSAFCASAPAKSAIPELKDLVRDNTDVGTLSVKILKQLLAINHVDYSNIVEKQELVQRVQRLVDNHRLEMKSEEDAAARDSSDQYSEENTCKICLDAMSNCVFLNCGHMSTCLDCGNRILNSGRRECPICREYIAKVVHVFRA